MRMAFTPGSPIKTSTSRPQQKVWRAWASRVKLDEQDDKKRRRKRQEQEEKVVGAESGTPSVGTIDSSPSQQSSFSRAARQDHSRRAFLVSAGVLASMALAGTKGAINPVEAARPMRRDKEVWAPLEDYMVVNERVAQTT